ncbi:MAG: APC family permease [Candidatus Heimdallarchaeota archaeon]
MTTLFTANDFLIGLLLIGLTFFIIIALTTYSLIQVVFYGRKRFIIGTDGKGPDAVLSGADLSRDMTVTQATMTGVGAMIGAGIFVLTGIAAGIAGPGLLVAFAFNGLIATLIAMVYAELGSAMPEAGGGYVWARAGLGETQGFFSGWMSWFAAAVAGSLYALGFSAYIIALLDGIGVHFPMEWLPIISKLIAVLAILAFLMINVGGSSIMGKAETWISGAKILILGFFIVTGILIMIWNPVQTSSNFVDFFPQGFFSIFVAMGFTFIAFEGYEVVTQTGEEIYDPKVSIPKSVILSVLLVIPIYLLVGAVSLGAFTAEGQTTWEFLAEHEELGLLFAAEQMIPGLGLLVILIGGILSTLSALNAALYSSTRVAFALGRDGSLPTSFASVSDKRRTPVVSIRITGIVVIIMAIAIPIEAVAAAADLMFMLLFLQVLIAAVIIRRKIRTSDAQLDYGYQTPLFPLIPILGAVALVILFLFTLSIHIEASLVTAIWLFTGLVVYLGYSKYRAPARLSSKLEKHARPRLEHLPEQFFTTVLENILVPLRGKPFEWDAIRIAIHIAHEYGAKVTLYHFGSEPEGSFSPFIDQFKLFGVAHELKMVSPNRDNPSPRDIIQHLIEVGSTGKYQLAILPSNRRRKFWEVSISKNAIRKMPIPGLQVFPGKEETWGKKLTFEHVGALIPGTARDLFLLQLGIAIVSSTRVADLVAYHWTNVPNLITPRALSEAPGVREDTAIFLHNIGEALRMGIPIQQRHVLGHDFVRSIGEIVAEDNLDCLVIGYGRPRLAPRPSIRLARKISCTTIVFHGRPPTS